MRCGDCKWWKRNTYEWIPDYMGDCSCPKFAYGNSAEDYMHDGLTYADHEGYSAHFRTGEDFGCIHFDSREQTETVPNTKQPSEQP